MGGALVFAVLIPVTCASTSNGSLLFGFSNGFKALLGDSLNAAGYQTFGQGALPQAYLVLKPMYATGALTPRQHSGNCSLNPFNCGF